MEPVSCAARSGASFRPSKALSALLCLYREALDRESGPHQRPVCQSRPVLPNSASRVGCDVPSCKHRPGSGCPAAAVGSGRRRRPGDARPLRRRGDAASPPRRAPPRAAPAYPGPPRRPAAGSGRSMRLTGAGVPVACCWRTLRPYGAAGLPRSAPLRRDGAARPPHGPRSSRCSGPPRRPAAGSGRSMRLTGAGVPVACCWRTLRPYRAGVRAACAHPGHCGRDARAPGVTPYPTCEHIRPPNVRAVPPPRSSPR